MINRGDLGAIAIQLHTALINALLMSLATRTTLRGITLTDNRQNSIRRPEPLLRSRVVTRVGLPGRRVQTCLAPEVLLCTSSSGVDDG